VARLSPGKTKATDENLPLFSLFQTVRKPRLVFDTRPPLLLPSSVPLTEFFDFFAVFSPKNANKSRQTVEIPLRL